MLCRQSKMCLHDSALRHAWCRHRRTDQCLVETCDTEITAANRHHPELLFMLHGLQCGSLHGQVTEVNVGRQAGQGFGLIGVIALLCKDADAILAAHKGLQRLHPCQVLSAHTAC